MVKVVFQLDEKFYWIVNAGVFEPSQNDLEWGPFINIQVPFALLDGSDTYQ